jgi:hypothetical protein
MSVQQEKSEIKSDQELETEEQPIVEVDSQAVVLNGSEVLDAASQVADEARISDYTAPRSNINHGHDTDKHDVRNRFGVRDDFVSEHFSEYGIAPNDHAALWLMSYKQEEFQNAETEVFRDTHDGDQSRWESIDSAKSSAPIAPKTQKELR